MSTVILKAPYDIYQEVNSYEVKLKEIDRFKNKLKRLFSNNKNKKEVKDKNINTLKECRDNLQRLSFEYKEDDKLYKRIQKALTKCNKMCKSYKIEDVSSVPNYDETTYGSKIKILVSSCTYLINQAIEKCNESNDAVNFIKSIENYYSQIESNLTKIEYIDGFVAIPLAIFDILGIIFKKNHWNCVTKFQKEKIDLLIKDKKEIEEKKALLRKGKIKWEEAHEALGDKYNYLNKTYSKFEDSWEESCYFSDVAMKKTFAEDNLINNGDIFKNFKLNFKLSEDIKNMIKKIVGENINTELNLITSNSQTKNLCEEIMKCKFNEIIQSIEKRKSFEELCKEIYIIDKQSKKIQFTDAGKSLSELKKIDSNIINKPCTVYEAVHQGEVTKMFPDGKVEYKLVNSNGVVMSKNTLCDNQEKALQCAEKLWRTRNEKIV